MAQLVLVQGRRRVTIQERYNPLWYLMVGMLFSMLGVRETWVLRENAPIGGG